jgi:hypothetical protein
MTKTALGMTKAALAMTKGALAMTEAGLGMTNWVLLESLNPDFSKATEGTEDTES